MDRDVFAAQFEAACASTLEIAAIFLSDPLPAALRFRVRLNSSYDGHPLVDDQVLYPEDSAFERALALHDVDRGVVLSELWRDGRVPEWIALQVSGATEQTTRLDVTCCGRFSATLPRQQGRPAFHLRSPDFPRPYVEGTRFSVHRHPECWTAAELAHAASHADLVWELELVGPAFGDVELAALPAFPALRGLVLRHTRVQGPGLAGLAHAPTLRTLQIHLAPPARVDLTRLPPRPRLDFVKVHGMPPVGLLRRIWRKFRGE